MISYSTYCLLKKAICEASDTLYSANFGEYRKLLITHASSRSAFQPTSHGPNMAAIPLLPPLPILSKEEIDSLPTLDVVEHEDGSIEFVDEKLTLKPLSLLQSGEITRRID